MRNETEIRSEREAARHAYVEAYEKLPDAQLRPLSNRVKALTRELAETLAAGANPCPDCGNAPHGMASKVGLPGGGTVPVYVVGCLVCRDRYSRSIMREKAVEAWNAGKYGKALR